MINLLYCGNEKVYDGLMLSLLSIVKHTTRPVNVFVLTMDLTTMDERYCALTQSECDYLDQIVKEANPQSCVRRIDATALFISQLGQSKNLETSYTPYTLLRLCADSLPMLPDHIIYLDTDTMANGDIGKLFDQDISSYEFAGVKDYLGRWFIRYNYINAGVLYLNLRRIRQTGLFANARKLCNERKMCFPDQTALNFLAKEKLYLPFCYNEQRSYHHDTVIQHFSKSIRWLPFYHTINVKPWQINDVHEKLQLFAYDNIFTEYDFRKKAMES